MRVMRSGAVTLGMVMVMLAAAGEEVEAQVTSYPDEVEYYESAISDYYDMPIAATPRWLDPDELPIVYLLAREAGVSPEVVIALREQGWSWLEITDHLRIDPYLYVARLPYSSGYWRRYSRGEVRFLTDRHFIDFVNLLFWADYHRRPVQQIIVIRERVPTWRHYVRYHAPRRVIARPVRRSAPPMRSPDPPRRAVPRGSTSARDQPWTTTRQGTPSTRQTPPSTRQGTLPTRQPPPPSTRQGTPSTRQTPPPSTRQGTPSTRQPPSTRQGTPSTRQPPSTRQAPSTRQPPSTRQAPAGNGGQNRDQPVRTRSATPRSTAAPATRGATSRPEVRSTSSSGGSAQAARSSGRTGGRGN